MSKLTKSQIKRHEQAVNYLSQDVLNYHEKMFVFENWREDATNINSKAGAFFTPMPLAHSFAVCTAGQGPHRIIDLCSGIGALAFQWADERENNDITCVEINPQYIEVGKKLVPEARWIQASVFDVPYMGLGHFDVAISNPPFGNIDRNKSNSPRYIGQGFEYHVMDIAAHISDYGAFILPQLSTPFRYSGEKNHSYQKTAKHDTFVKKTGIHLHCAGVDTDFARELWAGVSPTTEVAYCDFSSKEFHSLPLAQKSLFENAA